MEQTSNISSGIPMSSVNKNKDDPTSASIVSSSSSVKKLHSIRTFITVIAHLLIVTIVGLSLAFAFRNGDWPLGPTSQHIILCVIGYQLLMAEAILFLAPNSWASSLSVKHQRRVHWILQVTGSTLALTGCIIKTLHKSSKGINWNTHHGRFGLASMIFTTASLSNGIVSLYAYELRRFLPPARTKLVHILCGVLAFGTASTCLALGFDKTSFRSWASSNLADVIIIMTSTLTVIVIINPIINVYHKIFRH